MPEKKNGNSFSMVLEVVVNISAFFWIHAQAYDSIFSALLMELKLFEISILKDFDKMDLLHAKCWQKLWAQMFLEQNCSFQR